MAISYVLVDTAGTAHTLDATLGVQVGAVGRLPQLAGLGMAPMTVSEDKLIFAPGTRLRRVVTPAREVSIPLIVTAASASALEILLDSLRGWVHPGTENDATPKTCIFRVTRDDGVVREIEGVYAGGLEGDYAAGWATGQAAVLTLRAPDPHWRDTADTTLTVTRYDVGSLWFPLPPVNLVSSTVFAETTIVNAGQIEAWPVWTIVGPCFSVKLSNFTTGKVIETTVSMDSTDTLTIDTRPGIKSVVSYSSVTGTSGSAFHWLTVASDLWALLAGDNTVQVSAPNAGPTTAVSLAYRRRYVGVLR